METGEGGLGSALPAPSGGGYTPPTGFEYYGTASVSITNGDQLAWGIRDGAGPTLLDLTDPQNPTIVESGIYAFTGYIGPAQGGLSNNSKCSYELDWLPAGFIDPVKGRGSFTADDDPTNLGSEMPVVLLAYIPAGDTLQLFVAHNIGAPTLFGWAIGVQRIT